MDQAGCITIFLLAVGGVFGTLPAIHIFTFNDRSWRAPCKGGVSQCVPQATLLQPEAIGVVMDAPADWWSQKSPPVGRAWGDWKIVELRWSSVRGGQGGFGNTSRVNQRDDLVAG